MTKEEIIRMAREAGFDFSGAELSWESVICTEELERFAALVIANHPPQSSMAWQEGYEAGKQTEREACAKLCDRYTDSCSDHEAGTAMNIQEAIRARGKHD